MTPSWNHRDWLGLLCLWALLGLCFARLIAAPNNLIVDPRRPSVDATMRMGRPEIGNDLTRFLLPQRIATSQSWFETGKPSAWDPRGFGGRPRVGNPQMGLFYPPAWPAWRSKNPATLGWITLGHLAWAGVGAYVLSRACGMTRVGALVAAGCFEASPYLLAQTFEGHYPHIWSASWYPWAVLANLAWKRGRRFGALALPLILAMSLLTGHPQEGYYLLAALGCWWAYDLASPIFKRRRIAETSSWSITSGVGSQSLRKVRLDVAHANSDRKPAGWRLTVGVLLVFACTAGLSAVEFAPVLAAGEYSQLEVRRPLGTAGSYHVNIINLLQLLSPRALGGPTDYFGHDNYWEPLLSWGWAPLVLAVVAWTRSTNRGLAAAWSAVLAFSVLFACGWRLGLFTIAYHIVPGMSFFRVPSRSLFLGAMASASLAGLGIDALVGASAPWREVWKRYRVLALLLLVGLLVGRLATSSAAISIAIHPNAPRILESSRTHKSNLEREYSRWALAFSTISHEKTFWLAFVGVGGVLALASGSARFGRRAALAMAALALIELGVEGHGILRTSPPSVFTGESPIGAWFPQTGGFRVRAVDSLFTDLDAVLWGVEKANVNDSFQLEHALELYGPMIEMFRARPEGQRTLYEQDPARADGLAIGARTYERALRRLGCGRVGTRLADCQIGRLEGQGLSDRG